MHAVKAAVRRILGYEKGGPPPSQETVDLGIRYGVDIPGSQPSSRLHDRDDHANVMGMSYYLEPGWYYHAAEVANEREGDKNKGRKITLTQDPKTGQITLFGATESETTAQED